MSRGTIIFGAQRSFMAAAFQHVSGMLPTVLIRRPEDLTMSLLLRVKPTWVFLPDWSWIVPDNLLARSQFVGFHASELPDYRGGSPLQHQILDGMTETMLTCFRMERGLDAGNILCRKHLSLAGTVGDIWKRIATMVPFMIAQVLDGTCDETAQPCGGFSRKRRTPDDSRIPDYTGMSLRRLYDWMRALDDPYPNAFTVQGTKRLTFSRPTFDGTKLTAQVEITNE